MNDTAGKFWLNQHGGKYNKPMQSSVRSLDLNEGGNVRPRISISEERLCFCINLCVPKIRSYESCRDVHWHNKINNLKRYCCYKPLHHVYFSDVMSVCVYTCIRWKEKAGKTQSNVYLSGGIPDNTSFLCPYTY